MSNEIEIIDVVKGEWRTVTKEKEVTVGQRVRYECSSFKCGYDEVRTVKISENGTIKTECTGKLFNNGWKNIQAFFPIPVEPEKRKTAKVEITDSNYYWVMFAGLTLRSCHYTSRTHAIRGARRFCKAIGYECELVK